ncbi:MAG: hypothetical protein PHC46_04240 [Clostridia bacterium]|nr:hypothetical protein [Clostridia bacterium]
MKNLSQFNLQFNNYYKSYFNMLSHEFNDWLIGVDEDTPIPYEISLATFIISKSENLYSLSYSGHEQKTLKKLVAGDFIPLEGQYFFSKYLMIIELLSKSEKVKQEFILFIVEKLINTFLKTKNATFLKNKKIALGFAFTKPIYIH